MINLETQPDEGSNLFITVSLTDQNGNPVTSVTSMFWSLTDRSGNVINGKDRVEITTPSATETILVSGDDLLSEDGKYRVFLIEGVYQGDEPDVPYRKEAAFTIDSTVRKPV